MLFAFAALWAAAGISTVHDDLWMPIVSFAFAAASIFEALANMILHPAINGLRHQFSCYASSRQIPESAAGSATSAANPLSSTHLSSGREEGTLAQRMW